MVQWADFPWAERMYANADESILSKAVADVENAYSNEAGGHSRFPGLVPFAALPGATRVYVTSYQDDIVACTNAGRTYRISRTGAATDVTGEILTGGKRAIFDQTEESLLIAAGGPILKLAGQKAQILGGGPPDTTHVAYVDGYVLAIENFTERFYYCDPGQYETWNPLSTFSANAKADALNAVSVTPYRELLLVGRDSIEQYERLPNGNQPFSRRWSTGEGVMFPYTLVTDKSGNYGINSRLEFVKFFGQVSQEQGADVGLALTNIDDWTDAWASECSTKGQKFILLQAPFATNKHGTKGVTLLLDYRNRKWSFLFGWDDAASAPTRWPGWSLCRSWGRVYAGVPGGVALLDETSNHVLGSPQAFMIRSAHVSKFGPSRIDELRIRLRRGDGPDGADEPLIGLRVNRDNLGFDDFEFEPLGLHGEGDMVIRFGGQGIANTWQFELRCTDDVPLEFVSMQVYVEEMRW